MSDPKAAQASTAKAHLTLKVDKQAAKKGKASAASYRTITATCIASILQSDLERGGKIAFKSPCTLHLTAPLVIPAGDDVTLEGGAHRVLLEGSSEGSSTSTSAQKAVSVFKVKGGKLVLKDVTIADGEARGKNAQGGSGGSGGGKGGNGG